MNSWSVESAGRGRHAYPRSGGDGTRLAETWVTELWGLTRRIRLAIWELFERALYIAAFIVFERGLFFVLRFGVADAPKDLHVWFDGLLGVASVASAVTATGLFFIEYARVLWHFYRMDGGTDEDEA